jgi:ADP-ribose pyrophosphatase YjhB (NUDIX family)
VKAAVSAISIDHDRILLVRGSPLLPELWAPPGGKVEPHESLLEALMRETHEEVGVFPRPLRLITEVELNTPNDAYVLFSFLCDTPICPSKITARSDTLDARWLHLNEAMTLLLAPGVTTTLAMLSCSGAKAD